MLIILQLTKYQVPTHGSRKRGRGMQLLPCLLFPPIRGEKGLVFAHLNWPYINNTITKKIRRGLLTINFEIQNVPF